MHQRIFTKDKVFVSEVGLGCWQIGGNWGDVSDTEAKAILAKALDQGINFFDTADVYGDGRSESLIGSFLKNAREDVFVATKVGRAGLYPDGYSEIAVRKCIDASLSRLQVDTLELVQLHCIPFEVMKRGEIWEWLRELQVEGKIKRFGASVESMEEADWCVENVPEIYSLQIIFNIFRQKAIHTLFERAKAEQVGILARVPLASGLLSGKFTEQTSFGAEDHRNFNRDGEAFNVGETFAGLPYDKGVELANEIKKLVPPEVAMATWALRWILDHDAITTVIPGASNVQQVEGNAAASEIKPLPQEIHDELESIYRSKVLEHIRGPY